MGPEEVGRNLHYGIREHAMGAISNGLALHGGLRPFAATFLVFSDYMRPSVRLANLMDLPVVYVWTHDSIGLGGDGPTHQPVEHLAVAAGHAPAAGHPPGRRAGDGRGLAGGHRPHRRPHRPGPVPPGPAPDRPGGPRRRRGPAPGRLRARRGRRRRARGWS